nr:MAG TPA: hypothetical protein [Caudoviricetes sp.]
MLDFCQLLIKSIIDLFCFLCSCLLLIFDFLSNIFIGGCYSIYRTPLIIIFKI